MAEKERGKEPLSRLWKHFLVLLSILLLPGCVQPRVMEKLGLTVAEGYDDLGSGRIMGTDVMYQIDPDARDIVTVVSSTAFSSKGLRVSMNREISKNIQGGQLRVVVYHDRLAKKGIIHLVDTLGRDAEIGTKVYLTVSKGKTIDILSHRFPEVGNIGRFLYQTIQQNIVKEQILSCTLHEFLHDYYSPGKDPALPLIERVGNEIHLNEVALFQDDRMVGKFRTNEAVYIKIMRNNFKAGIMELSLNSQQLLKAKDKQKYVRVGLQVLSNSSKVRLVDPKNLRFQIKVKLQAQLAEISTEADLTKKEVVNALQSGISKEISKNAKKVLDKLQKVGSDPVGFGERYLSSVRGATLTSEEWHKMLRKASFDVQVNVRLIRTGVME